MNHPDSVLEHRNKFVAVNRSIVEFEIRPGNTVSFLHLVDLTQVEAIRTQAEANGHTKPSYTAFVVKALGMALREFPYANRRVVSFPASWLGTRLQRFTQCDVAVACERALPGAECVAFADILRNADQLSLDESTLWLQRLSSADVENNPQWASFSGLVQKFPVIVSKWAVRLPFLLPSLWVRYRGAAALVSSPAKYGIDAVAGSWSWPVGVSFGVVKARPMVDSHDQVIARPTFQLTLNFDRRIMAGAQAAKFFRRIVDALERAETELR